MNDILIIALTVLYFVMGAGAFNLWKAAISDGWMLFIIILWPAILFVAAILPSEKLN